ncbi:DMT family transporter [Candidatus Woesearchaeota archaeon]|nr:DMT family transporter [Candidatus Woesearchaeota archaeon]
MVMAWLFLGILSFLSYSISTSIDKHMMSKKYDVLRTNTLKMLFDGLILLVLGIIFFELNLKVEILIGAFFLGLLYAAAGVAYFTSLRLGEVSKVVPFLQSSEILLTFIAAIIIFQENASIINFLGVALIILGAYAVLSEEQLRLPRLGKLPFLIFLVTLFDVAYWLLAKKLLFDIKPIDLGVGTYLSSAVILFIYQLLFRRKTLEGVPPIMRTMPKIALAAFFGAMGTLLVFSALSIADASDVYPLAGLQSVFIFVIALIFLKEKFCWHRLLGTALVAMGIFCVSL